MPGNVRVVRTDNIPKDGDKYHNLCGKVHAKRQCSQQCSGCKKWGSHLEENCWELYPDKKPKFNTPRKDRKGRGRGRSRSKSEEKGEKDKKDKRDKRDNSPYPGRAGRVTTDRDRFTDRDSDESEKDKEMEREYLAAVEKAEQIKEKFEKQKQTRSARRIRTGRTAADIFADDSSEAQYNQLERDWARGSSPSTRGPSGRLRRVKKCSPPSPYTADKDPLFRTMCKKLPQFTSIFCNL